MLKFPHNKGTLKRKISSGVFNAGNMKQFLLNYYFVCSNMGTATQVSFMALNYSLLLM